MRKDLKKELSLLDVFCIATGAMISSGLFILPGMAFAKAGPAVVVSYLLAAVLCIPTALSQAELSTAMPKAGGDYYYITRGFGPFLGTIAGFSSWFALSFKGAFALLGMGAYLRLLTDMPINIIALWCCVFFIALNLVGIKFAARSQIVLVLGLLVLLGAYVFLGMKSVKAANLSPFFALGTASVFSTASFVFISYGGLTKVVSLAEEVNNPAKTLPLGIILSLAVTALFYGLVIYVTVGVLDPQVLSNTLIPISAGAGVFGGKFLTLAVSIAAFCAFVSTANAGIMTASRYPFGMSRDKFLPAVFQRISSKFRTPYAAIMFTGSFMAAAILFLKLELLVKIASSVLILLFVFANLTLILFRESKIFSYHPKFRAPMYPYLQVVGILGGMFLLIEMGTVIIFLTMGFLFLGAGWYKVYVQKRVTKDSALIYLLERMVARDKELTSDNLLTELKDIVIQRDQIVEDRFHRLIERCQGLDIDEPVEMTNFFARVCGVLSAKLGVDSKVLLDKFIERESVSSTVLRPGLSVPHVVIDGRGVFEAVLVRAKSGVIFPQDKIAHIIFVLVASADERNFHLKALAAIAQITMNPEFDKKWANAKNWQDLKNVVLLAERRRT